MRFHFQLCLLAILFPFMTLKAQDQHKIDSLTQVLNKTKDHETRFQLYSLMSSLDQNPKKYMNEMMLNAELSGSTELQLRTYSRLSDLATTDSAQIYLDKMFALAKEKRNVEYQGWYYLFTGALQYYTKGNSAKVMENIQEADRIAADNDLDSLAFEVNGVMATIHQDKGERLLQYKSYMKQLSLAGKIGNGFVAVNTYWQMFWFYNTLKQFPKAKDCALLILEKGKKKNWPDWIIGGHHLLIHYYTNVGEFETAKYYYNETNRLRKQYNRDLSEDDDLLDIYTNSNDFLRLLGILQKEDIKKSFFKRDTTGFQYYGQLANCYTKLGIKDSAFYFLGKMNQASENAEMNKWLYYSRVGDYFKLINNADSAAAYYSKADSGIGLGNNLTARLERYANLDTLYSRQGNYQKAYFYKTLWMQYKDSASALSKEGDLVVMEIDNETQRQEAEIRASHNIQYMGITVGLASVFILLVFLGVFSTSSSIIKGLSFFAFIFFFEFLILLFDNFIHELTHGEPWKVLSIKIVLIAMLLPLHHYIEKKVSHHLQHRKKISIFKRKTKTAEA